jgi:hypothetical protein
MGRRLEKKEKDVLIHCWSSAVKERDQYIDQWDLCSYGTDPHHIFGRGTSIINKYDIGNGVTLSRKNHNLAENQKMGEFEIFIKNKLGSLYDKIAEQKNIVGIPFDYEAMFFNDYYKTKKQELEEYYKINGVQLNSKQSLLKKFNTIDFTHCVDNTKNLKLKNNSLLLKRFFCFLENNMVTELVENMFLKLKKIDMKNNYLVSFCIHDDNTKSIPMFSLYLYELLREEVEYIYDQSNG